MEATPRPDPAPAPDRALQHEQIANESKHWVRLTAACNSRCIFCLDSEAQDGRVMDWESACREIRRGREEQEATRIVLSGGEASIHPRFHDFVRYSRAQGYRWIQTVSNGRMFAKREFFLKAVEAGLSEITFSLHGHNAELHDRLTQAPGSFDQLMKAMMRAVRDGRIVVNVDVVINKQNVAHLEKIVAICAQVGVREFDLLHVIPQGEAFDHREELFYDPAEHAETLRRVFRLAKNPAFHLWTNRFPLAHLEGVEELIQDPHKMLDEVGGRRMQFRRYLDAGAPIDCRDAARCPHCFIEPFCSSLDRRVAQISAGQVDVLWLDAPLPPDRAPEILAGWAGSLPGGALRLGGEIPAGWAGPRHVGGALTAAEVAALPAGSVWQLRGVAELEAAAAVKAALLAAQAPGAPGVQRDAPISIEISLDRDVAAWLLADPGWLSGWPDRLAGAGGPILIGTTWATMEETARQAPDFAAFFLEIGAKTAEPVRARGLPACLCPGTVMLPALTVLRSAQIHDDGRLAIDAEVDRYTAEDYRAKSLRCSGCAVTDRCGGGHIQFLRHRGFAALQPIAGAWAGEARRQLADRPLAPGLAAGSPPLPPPPRLPMPQSAPVPEIDVVPGRRS